MTELLEPPKYNAFNTNKRQSKYFILLLEKMREMCPNELDFTTAFEKAKESLRKARQRHNENVSLQRKKGQVSKSPSSK